uniref:Uncharacterized protein n=1 Tax=Oryza glumipatula TaxID=40148 RepID=A0A0E0B445_9ORYZ
MWSLNEGSNSNVFKKGVVVGSIGKPSKAFTSESHPNIASASEATKCHLHTGTTKLQSSSAPPDHRRHIGPPVIATAIEVRSSPNPSLDTTATSQPLTLGHAGNCGARPRVALTVVARPLKVRITPESRQIWTLGGQIWPSPSPPAQEMLVVAGVRRGGGGTKPGADASGKPQT